MQIARSLTGVLSAAVLSLVASAAVAQEAQPPAAAPQPAPAAPSQQQQNTAPLQQAAGDTASPTSAPPAATAKQSLSEEMVVTGSRLRRKDLNTPAPVTVVTRQQFETSGKMTIGDYLQAMPEQGNAPNFQLNTGGINYGADGTTRINLRSLGIQRTLVLVNGRRMVPGGLGASAAVDLNTIPTEAIERIEVLKDGGSALYGSDAIAGVVNIITRRNYSGTDVGAQYGVSGHGDAQTFDAHVTTGTTGENSSALFSVRYFNQSDSWLRDRSWSQQALDNDYTGGGVAPSGSSRTPQGTVQIPQDKAGNPVCNGNPLCLAMIADGWTATKRWIRDPAGKYCGPNGAGQTECFRVFNTPAPDNGGTGNDFYNYAAENYLTIPSTTIQGYSQGDAKFNFARGYYELSYTQRSSTQNAAPMPLNPADYNNIVVSKNNIYNPFGTDLDFLGRRLVEFGNRTYSEDLGTFHVVAGVDGALPAAAGPLSGWFWDTSLNYGRTSGTFTTGGSFRNSRVANAVGPSMIDATGKAVCVQTPGDLSTVIPGCSPINLLGGPNNGSIDPTQINYLGYSGTSRAYDALFTIDANTGGDLFMIAADRPAALALGYQYRRQLGSQIADPIVADGDSADFNFKSTNGGFYANEVYGELSLPILANIPGVEALEADVAGRYVNYSTFGGNFSYKFGARYTPIRDITIRGTYSTAFRAPNIGELYLGATETDPAATDPCADLSGRPSTDPLVKQCQKYGVPIKGSGDAGLQELTRQGGNPKLGAETAKILTAGIVVQPQMVRNLSVAVDYFNVTVDNAIGTIGASNILQGCYTNLNDDYCQLVVRNNSGRIQYVNDLNQNVGSRKTGGIDAAIRYQLPTEQAGRFAFAVDGSYLLFFDNTLNLATGTQTFAMKDYYDAANFGAMPQFKATGSIDWSLAGALVGLTGRYVSSFTECSNPGDPTTAQGGNCYLDATHINPYQRRVSSYFQVDLHAGYTLSTSYGKTSIFAGVSNLFDKAPPYIYSAALANSDPTTYDYLGRYVYGRVQHRF